MSDLKQEFETWTVSHGSLLLEPAAEMTCENGWFPATYHSAMTEIAWRAFANRRTQPEATAPAQDLSAAILALPIPAHWMAHQAVVMGYMAALKDAAALTSSANALSAGDSEKQRIALIAAVQNYLVDVVRSFGDVSCAAYISTWHKPETINAAILQSQKGGGHG